MYIFSQKYIYFLYFCFKFIISIEYLEKYSSKEINCRINDFIVFNSSDFTIPSTLHFKISTSSIFERNINYEFYDIFDNININEKFKNPRFVVFPTLESSEIINQTNFSINYYNIEKDKNHVIEGKGDNLILNFLCGGILKIENTVEDSSVTGLSTEQIIGIVFGVVGAIAIIIVIIYFCYKCKNKEKQENKENDEEADSNKKIKFKRNNKKRKRTADNIKIKNQRNIIGNSGQRLTSNNHKNKAIFPQTSGSSIK